MCSSDHCEQIQESDFNQIEKLLFTHSQCSTVHSTCYLVAVLWWDNGSQPGQGELIPRVHCSENQKIASFINHFQNVQPNKITNSFCKKDLNKYHVKDKVESYVIILKKRNWSDLDILTGVVNKVNPTSGACHELFVFLLCDHRYSIK